MHAHPRSMLNSYAYATWLVEHHTEIYVVVLSLLLGILYAKNNIIKHS